MRHSQKDYVVRVAASPGDKTQILMTPHRLTDTEFHAVSSHSVGTVRIYGCMQSEHGSIHKETVEG
jgi:hypothetical protein